MAEKKQVERTEYRVAYEIRGESGGFEAPLRNPTSTEEARARLANVESSSARDNLTNLRIQKRTVRMTPWEDVADE